MSSYFPNGHLAQLAQILRIYAHGNSLLHRLSPASYTYSQGRTQIRAATP